MFLAQSREAEIKPLNKTRSTRNTHSITEPPHDKTNKVACAPAKTDQPGHPPSLIRVFAVRMKKPWVLSYPLSAQRRLIRLGGCHGWSEPALGAHATLLVLSWGGSVLDCNFDRELLKISIQEEHVLSNCLFYFDRKELECAKFLENLEDIFRQAITTLPCVYNWNRIRTAAVAYEAVTETIRVQRWSITNEKYAKVTGDIRGSRDRRT